MSKKSLILSFIIIILAIVIINYAYKKPKTIIINKEITELKDKENKLEDKRDSIKKEIDTVFINLNKNEEHYKEVCEIIDSFSIDSDYIFFSKYIESYSKRFDDINNK